MPKTLLLADDSVTIQRVIELTFAHEDVRVVSVGDGRRAVEWLETETPDIVLADVGVPEVNGYELALHVKQSPRLHHVPVILLAGAFEPVDQDRVRATGCDGVLVKPFEPQQLVSRVRELLTPAPMLAASIQRASVAEPPAGPHPVSSGAALASVADDSRGPFSGTQASPIQNRTSGSEPIDTPAQPVPPPPRVSLVNAFSALLAAERSTQPVPSLQVAGVPSDASVEDAVRRVLARMTDDLVRRIVVETAERLIKEEIEKIKANPG